MIEGLYEVERLVQEAIGQLAVVRSNLVNADLEDIIRMHSKSEMISDIL